MPRLHRPEDRLHPRRLGAGDAGQSRSSRGPAARRAAAPLALVIAQAVRPGSAPWAAAAAPSASTSWKTRPRAAPDELRLAHPPERPQPRRRNWSSHIASRRRTRSRDGPSSSSLGTRSMPRLQRRLAAGDAGDGHAVPGDAAVGVIQREGAVVGASLQAAQAVGHLVGQRAARRGHERFLRLAVGGASGTKCKPSMPADRVAFHHHFAVGRHRADQSRRRSPAGAYSTAWRRSTKRWVSAGAAHRTACPPPRASRSCQCLASASQSPRWEM